MTVEWTEHRFAGGALALDVANTVVLRSLPAQRFDRFDDRSEIARFAKAAERFRSDEHGGSVLIVRDANADDLQLIELREAIDALFRDAAQSGRISDRKLPVFLRACADAIERGAGSLLASTAYSALSLLAPDALERLRICDNCGWLFVDRSRNGSRRWCDMKVCGNRRKAARHYQRRKAEAA